MFGPFDEDEDFDFDEDLIDEDYDNIHYND